MVAVLAVLPRYPRYYRWNGYKICDITAVLGTKNMRLQWGWGPGSGTTVVVVGFFSRTCNFVKGSSLKNVHTGGRRGVSRNADKSGQGGRGDFSASGRPHFTQHVGQEDSVTTLACKLCIQYIAI